MSCSNCRNGADGTPRGCQSNGNCGVGGCGPLTVFDWLEGVALPTGQTAFDVVEVRFKANRKGFYRGSSQLEIQVGDVVVVGVVVVVLVQKVPGARPFSSLVGFYGLPGG